MITTPVRAIVFAVVSLCASSGVIAGHPVIKMADATTGEARLTRPKGSFNIIASPGIEEIKFVNDDNEYGHGWRLKPGVALKFKVMLPVIESFSVECSLLGLNAVDFFPTPEEVILGIQDRQADIKVSLNGNALDSLKGPREKSVESIFHGIGLMKHQKLGENTLVIEATEEVVVRFVKLSYNIPFQVVDLADSKHDTKITVLSPRPRQFVTDSNRSITLKLAVSGDKPHEFLRLAFRDLDGRVMPIGPELPFVVREMEDTKLDNEIIQPTVVLPSVPSDESGAAGTLVFDTFSIQRPADTKPILVRDELLTLSSDCRFLFEPREVQVGNSTVSKVRVYHVGETEPFREFNVSRPELVLGGRAIVVAGVVFDSLSGIKLVNFNTKLSLFPGTFTEPMHVLGTKRKPKPNDPGQVSGAEESIFDVNLLTGAERLAYKGQGFRLQSVSSGVEFAAINEKIDVPNGGFGCVVDLGKGVIKWGLPQGNRFVGPAPVFFNGHIFAITSEEGSPKRFSVLVNVESPEIKKDFKIGDQVIAAIGSQATGDLVTWEIGGGSSVLRLRKVGEDGLLSAKVGPELPLQMNVGIEEFIDGRFTPDGSGFFFVTRFDQKHRLRYWPLK